MKVIFVLKQLFACEAFWYVECEMYKIKWDMIKSVGEESEQSERENIA